MADVSRRTHAAFAAEVAWSPIFEVASPILEVMDATFELAVSAASAEWKQAYYQLKIGCKLDTSTHSRRKNQFEILPMMILPKPKSCWGREGNIVLDH